MDQGTAASEAPFPWCALTERKKKKIHKETRGASSENTRPLLVLRLGRMQAFTVGRLTPRVPHSQQFISFLKIRRYTGVIGGAEVIFETP